MLSTNSLTLLCSIFIWKSLLQPRCLGTSSILEVTIRVCVSAATLARWPMEKKNGVESMSKEIKAIQAAYSNFLAASIRTQGFEPNRVLFVSKWSDHYHSLAILHAFDDKDIQRARKKWQGMLNRIDRQHFRKCQKSMFPVERSYFVSRAIESVFETDSKAF